jgi:hypothetical protein
MNINFFDERCQNKTHSSKFGLCDEPSPSEKPAYIDTDICNEQEKWIAIVENKTEIEITFTAIDKCIAIKRVDGKMDSRCDGMLTYWDSIIFVELKERAVKNNVWVGKGEQQLRNAIRVFKENHSLDSYQSKKAYIANNKKPNFQSSQTNRMEKFKDDTGFRLRIENNIKI